MVFYAKKAERYIDSRKYETGMKATQIIWSKPDVFRLSGLYIYINQFVIPPIITIEKRYSARFNTPEGMLKDLQSTRLFLHRLFSLTKEDDWQGGLENHKVINMLAHYGEIHKDFLAMEQWMMQYMGQIIALAPIRVLPKDSFNPTMVRDYYEYMQYAWLIMGVEMMNLNTTVRTEQGTKVENLARSTAILKQHLTVLKSAYEIRYDCITTGLLWEKVLLSLEKPVLQVVIASQQ